MFCVGAGSEVESTRLKTEIKGSGFKPPAAQAIFQPRIAKKNPQGTLSRGNSSL